MALSLPLVAHKAAEEAEAAPRAIVSQARDGLEKGLSPAPGLQRPGSVPPQARSKLLSLLTRYLEQQDSPSARNRRPGLRSQAACGVCPARGPDTLTPGLAALPCMLHSSLHPCRSQPVRSHCSLLSSLAESPSLYRVSTKDCPPLPAPSSASLPPAPPPQRMFVTLRGHFQCHTEPCILHTANNV